VISSRTHAALDLGLVAALAGVALLPGRSPRVRWLAAGMAAAQAGTGALTDYEGGVSPRIGVQENRALDVASAAALGGFGAAWRSPALLGAGAATLAVALLSEGRTHGGAPSMLYPPLDTPKRLAPDVWVVDSAVDPGIPVRMTVIRLEGGDLVLHSPTRHRAGLQRALEAIGPIRHLVAPNIAHWMFAKDWQDAVPGATTYGAPGLAQRGQVRRSGLRIDQVLSSRAPAAWEGQIEQAVVPGHAGFHEVAMFHRASGSVLMTDLVQNFEPAKLPWVVRPLAWLMGNTTARSRAPAYLRALFTGRPAAAAEAARRVVGWRPDRVVVTHGRIIESGAAERLRRSLGWLTGEG